jgi:hypothetical protein
MKTMQQSQRPAPGPAEASLWLGRAWGAIALVPVFFLIAFAVGEGLYSAFGYDSGGSAPVWVELIVLVAVVAVCLVSCAAAVYAGRRAIRAGNRSGRIPEYVGLIAGAGWIILALVTTIADLVRR